VLVVFLLFFAGRLPFGAALRARPIFKAFREAELWQYGAVVLMRSPALLSAVVVYTPRLWAPAARGGDMISLTFVAVSGISALALVIGSRVAVSAGKVWTTVRRPRVDS